MLGVCGNRGEVVAVGGDGDHALVLVWNGTEWLQQPIPADAGVLWWCWASPSGEIFAVGEDDTVLRRTVSGQWTLEGVSDLLVAPTTFFGVWGTSSTDVFIVGGSPSRPDSPAVILQNKSGSWAPVNTNNLPRLSLFKVWGSSPDSVWAVGSGGSIVHYDGDTWRPISSPTNETIIALWGSGPDDVFAVGGETVGTIIHFDGSDWTQFATTPELLSGVWTAPGQPLLVAGNRGFIARYRRSSGDVKTSGLRTTVVANDVCFHAMHRVGNDDTLVAAASDLFAGGRAQWRGAVYSNVEDFAGATSFLAPPDAGIIDDDAGTEPDATPEGLGPGEICESDIDGCQPGLECLGIVSSSVLICTQECDSAADCTAYGEGACCARPGPQLLTKTCIPAQYPDCSG
jgi:hypothetical protein